MWYAYVQSMDNYGHTIIKFSKTIDQNGLNFRDFNSSAIDIYLEPYQDWPEGYTEFNYSKFNFTWELLSIYNDTLELNISFHEPHWISR